MPEVSVIIPTWNRVAQLKGAILSALSQTIHSLEVLVCDDGSTDNTHQMVESIGDNRVRLIVCPHGGQPSIPRNCGINEASGNWLAFLDDDDEWLPDKLQKEIALAQKLDCFAACSNALRFLPGKVAAGNYLSHDKNLVTFNDLLQVNLVICSSAVIHRSLIPVIEGFPEDEDLVALEDYSLWLRVATQTDFAYVQEPLVIYYDQPEYSIRSRCPGIWNQRRRVLGNLLHWLRNKKVSGVSLKTHLYYYQAFLRSLF